MSQVQQLLLAQLRLLVWGLGLILGCSLWLCTRCLFRSLLAGPGRLRWGRQRLVVLQAQVHLELLLRAVRLLLVVIVAITITIVIITTITTTISTLVFQLTITTTTTLLNIAPQLSPQLVQHFLHDHQLLLILFVLLLHRLQFPAQLLHFAGQPWYFLLLLFVGHLQLLPPLLLLHKPSLYLISQPLLLLYHNCLIIQLLLFLPDLQASLLHLQPQPHQLLF